MITSTFIGDLHSFLEGRLPAYLDLLRQMVAINSFTTNVTGINTLGILTAEAFAELGFEAERVPAANSMHGDHLVLHRGGLEGQDSPTIALVSHLDTVFPPDEERRNRFSWRVEGDRIYGPGTVDIKGGTVAIFMMLSALKDLAPDTFDAANWLVLLNSAEEVLASDFAKLCVSWLPADSLACLVFEGGRLSKKGFRIVTARKGMVTYRLTSEGRSAHAGSSHRNGANAIVQLADTISDVAALTDYERDLTFNIGTAAGGTVINRVPHFAAASGEMRAFSAEAIDDGLSNLLELANKSSVESVNDAYRCRVEIEILGRWEPWPQNESSDGLFDVWHQAGRHLGVVVRDEHRGGLSDGNSVWNHVPTIDGLGPSGGNAHCSERSEDGSKDQEFVRASSFVPKTALNTVATLQMLGRLESGDRP
jgi:glutamate carboxypeptidase